jgi:hypothetical protein
LLLLNLIGVGGVLAVWLMSARTLYQTSASDALRVFLRADQTVRLHAWWRSVRTLARWRWAHRTLDEILPSTAALRPVIAIGDPRDPRRRSAARIFVEGAGAEWQDVVRALAGALHAPSSFAPIGERACNGNSI